ncbi:hypothetical protein H097_12958 [Pseudomonas sp. FH4]|uniref:hypothetical protein n=1 Tax=Pseudomonas fluorescens group TaxID=136843 RepID=UPI0003DC2748|nr:MULTISPECIES: hypothetical protein [Pseudomonas fluorescens group]ETK18215.1 hypothetical protein H097_12958 [Pseudomonas sp. FH4]MBF8007149.1 hypothetical protein [Pseudomonas brenneri]
MRANTQASHSQTSLDLQLKLDNMTAAFQLLAEQYNEAVRLLDISTTALEGLTIAIVEGTQ